MAEPDQDQAAEAAVAYHERTKHHFHRFAASLGYLDWATQPNPFRRFAGTDVVRLPLPSAGRPLLYRHLYSARAVRSEALSLGSLSLFLRYSLSLTAWKSVEWTRWSLRANPSSGNLHPTEGYLVLPAIDGVSNTPGVHHYAPSLHALERRASFSPARWRELIGPLPDDTFLVGLSSILWRESWKYGERAFRYCQHDVGHALGALRIAAAALGWKLALIDGVGDEAVASLMGLDRAADFDGAEREEPELLALVGPDLPAAGGAVAIDTLTAAADVTWYGEANTLSQRHVAWPVIDEVAEATRPRQHAPAAATLAGLPAAVDLEIAGASEGRLTAEQAILGRRSALAMDGRTAISRTAFFQMLARVMPTSDSAMPWDAIAWRPRIHLGLFVHRVDGLAPGLYALPRDPARRACLSEAMMPDFLWEPAPDAPPGLQLYLLKECDCRALAARISCGQDIAADGAFSLSMIADYMGSLRSEGAAFYRNLYWEAGLVGQVLYLEAEEAGVRSTGIGCYFDDPAHEAFGISTREWQILYHFTVGGPVEDPRLTSLPAYGPETADA